MFSLKDFSLKRLMSDSSQKKLQQFMQIFLQIIPLKLYNYFGTIITIFLQEVLQLAAPVLFALAKKL